MNYLVEEWGGKYQSQDISAKKGLGVKELLEKNPDICETTGSVNPVVCECNDCGLNDIRGLHVTEQHVFAALADCKADFAEGAVGAGRGMRCHGLKGGIGSASRVVELDGKPYTMGALVLSNHALFDDLIVAGTPIHTAKRICHITCDLKMAVF